VLFWRAIQLSVSSKHWAEVTYGRPIQLLSVPLTEVGIYERKVMARRFRAREETS
jgi:hypothetical protein